MIDLGRSDWRWVEYYQFSKRYVNNPVVDLLKEKPYEHRLTAELMPLTIWVAASGGLQQRDLAESLEMVEAGEVHLVAAMLNQEPPALARMAFLGKFGLPV